MSQIFLQDGLIYTTAVLSHKDRTVTLKNVLIDTGSSSTVISGETAAKLGLKPEPNDIINSVQGIGGSETVVEKVIDYITLDTSAVEGFRIQVGAMDYGIALEALLGIDLLAKTRAVLDLSNFTIKTS